MCAQVDYRDEDLQEALINITGGMSFSVRTSAAQAAGFTQTELLAKCMREDKVGQMVVEMSDCRDLVLAPDYDLRARLKALVQHHLYPEVMTTEAPVIERLPEKSADLQRALEAYDAGHRTQTALALALGMSAWDVRPLHTKVKQIRGQAS